MIGNGQIPASMLCFLLGRTFKQKYLVPISLDCSEDATAINHDGGFIVTGRRSARQSADTRRAFFSEGQKVDNKRFSDLIVVAGVDDILIL